jgi:hypothetical protein
MLAVFLCRLMVKNRSQFAPCPQEKLMASIPPRSIAFGASAAIKIFHPELLSFYLPYRPYSGLKPL